MKLSEELHWRGFVNQTTLKDLNELDKEPLAFYWGVDPSADSMTIGNLAAAMMVRHFITYGHRAFLLVGGATGMIGDPDGKSDERNLKTLDEINHNKTAITKQYQTVFDNQKFTIVDNYDWFSGIGYLDFLRNVGKHVPMSQMLSRDFVQSRLGDTGSGISYAEFSYSLIQGYDYVHLSREYGVSLQVCGADQWGNSIAGVDLIRRLDGKEAHVYSTPLIVNKTTGVKFGKSEGGAVWLDPNKTSVYSFYQFWLNVDDEGVIDYMKIYTLLSQKEIEEIRDIHSANPSARYAQKYLAKTVTATVHGEHRAKSAEDVSKALFGDKSLTELNEDDIELLSQEIPTVDAGRGVVDIMVDAGIVSSNGEARRLILGGGISINGQKVTDDVRIVKLSLLKKGKNSFVLIR